VKGRTLKTGPIASDEARELDFGLFRIRPDVLEAIAGIAASSVDGVTELAGPAGARGARGKRAHARGVTVDLADAALSAKLHVVVKYGLPIHEVGCEVQRTVADALLRMTGTPVDSVEVFVDGVTFDEA
jgi:uncharacterized alkaline shock family protein YloU